MALDESNARTQSGCNCGRDKTASSRTNNHQMVLLLWLRI